MRNQRPQRQLNPKGRITVLALFLSVLLGTFASIEKVAAQTIIDTALETPNLDWQSNGLWTLQTDVAADNEDALASGPLADEEAAILALTLEGPLTGSFWWKVSSEADFDYLYFAIDGEIIGEISGDVDWEQASFELSEGEHELQWIYEKDEGGADGADRGWLDRLELSLPNVPLKITQQPSDQTVVVGQSVSFTVVVEGSGNIAYQWYFGDEPIPGADTPSIAIETVSADDAGDYSVYIENETEEAESTVARLTVTDATSPTTPSNPGNGNTNNGTTWTILIYGHGDHNLSTSLVRDMLEMEQSGSADGFNIVLQADFNASDKDFASFAIDSGIPRELHTGITRYLVGSDTDSDPNTFNTQPIGRLPESMNMDLSSTLKDFLTWGIQTYPADRYGIVFWNHGGQWEGFGGDTQDGVTHTDGLSTAVIRKAVKETMAERSVSKFEFVAFDTCLMGGAEVLIDFVDICDLFIANAELDYGDGLEYGGELNILKNNPGIDIFEFGRQEVPVWDAHHQTQVDNALKVHATFDLRKFSAFSQSLNAFAKELKGLLEQNNLVIPTLQRQTVHYNIAKVSEISKPTDYIDLGEFADKIASHGSSSARLKSTAQAVSQSIDNMILGLTAGTKRQGKVHGLSIYYPTAGVNEQNVYLDLAFNALPDAAWQGFLGAVSERVNGDQQAPGVSVGSSGSARRSGNDRAGDFFYVGSLDDPASLVFNLEEADDAYGFYSALISNGETGDPNEYVYLGEIANGLADGPGEYELLWDTTMPTISASEDDSQPYLGGWFQEPGSDIMVSYADYTAPGEEEPIEVVLITQLGEEAGEIIQVLDSANETLSAVADVTLAPGGKLTPVYYTELRQGEPDTWDTYEIFFEEDFIIIPEGGIKDIAVDYTPAFLGDYTVEILVTDIFDNESDILNFPVLVVDDITDLPKNPTLSIGRGATGELQISWPASDAIGFILQSTASIGTTWSEVPAEQINYDEATDQESVLLTNDSEGQFFRLFKPQPTP